MKKHIVGSLLLLAFLCSASGGVFPIFSDDFESGTMANWTVTSTTPNPLDPSTAQNAVPPSPTGRWSAFMNTSIDRMHHNIIADNGGAEAGGHLMFTAWIYDEGINSGTVGATRIYNEIRGYSAGTGLPNGGTTASGTLDALLAAGKFNSTTLPGEVFTTTKYQGRVAFGPGTGGSTGWFNLNGPGSPNRSVGWHRFDIEVMPGGSEIKFYVDGILSRTFSGAAVDTYDTVILGPGLGSQQGNAWIDGISIGVVDDAPTITCPPNQSAIASSAAGAPVTYPAATASDDSGTATVNCNPPSGSNFPVGTTTVTCVATDSRGQTATCTFNVTVAPPNAPEHLFGSNTLPPPEGMYVTPAQFHAAYAQGIIIRDVRHRRFTGGEPPPAPGASKTHSFGSLVQMEVSMDGGNTYNPVSAPAQVTVMLRSTTPGTYDTEMLQLDISGGGLPPGVMIRESPTRASTGRTTVRQNGGGAGGGGGSGGYMIGSFFDVFTELTVDGGMNWGPADQPAHVEVQRDPTTVPPMPAPTNLLPPPNHFYVSPAQYHALYAQGIIIRDVRHKLFTRSLPPPPLGAGPQTHTFDSQVDMQVSMDGGQTWRPMRAPAAVQVLVTPRSMMDGMDVFDTEMLALNLQGGDLPPGTMIRESPTRRSEGGTAIQSLPDGTYRIHSFFDIFTELSVDGGANWAPADPTHVELSVNALETPEPSPVLPPPDGNYVTPAEYHAAYAQGIIIKDIKHNRFTQSQPPPPPGGSQTHSFGSQVQFMVSMDGGATFSPGNAPANAIVLVRSSQENGATRYFDTEMLQLNIQGGSLPPGVMIRESPTKASLGRTSVRQTPTAYQISSFFDIFTELTVNGGQNWSESLTGPAGVNLFPGPCYHLTCPPNQVVYTSSSSGAVVTYPPPVFSFDPPCTLPVTPYIHCEPPSGSTFPVGTTHVVCYASVAPGASYAGCGFDVTVRRRLPYVFDLTVARIRLLLPSGGTEDITLMGASDVEMDLGADGSAGDLDGDGLDDAATQMTSLQLDGMSQSFGPMRLRLRESPARGMTEENANMQQGMLETPADSFFDVFVEIEASGMVLHTATPVHMAATLRGIPPAPGDTYVDTTPHDVVDANGNPTGVRLIQASHTPVPRPVDITCPKNIIVRGSGPTPVNYPPPTVTGDCQPISVVCNPPSGSNFPVGSTIVNCLATDACGNKDQCRFLVTVYYVEPTYVNFPTDHLPPPEGMYVNPFRLTYANGVILRNIIHRRFDPSYPPPPLGATAVHEFDSELSFEYSTDGGASYGPATAPAHVVVQVTHTHDDGPILFFDTEMLALDISGGGLPPGVMIRESPTKASLGKTSIKSPRDSASGQAISSFFDVFTELSLDGGANWSPSADSERVQLQFDPTQIPPVNPPAPNLPPRHGIYVSPARYHQLYGQGIIIRDIRHRYFTQSVPPPAPGESQLHEFGSLVDFQLSLDEGQTWMPMRANGDAKVVMTHQGRLLESADAPATDVYDTEMLQLDISGGDLPPGVMLRESPTRRSEGGTAVQQLPDGTYRIGSFFDVFTELTLDGGHNWMEPTAPSRVELQMYAQESDNPTDQLPPPTGCFKLSDLDPHVSYGGGAQMLKDVLNRSFSESMPPPPFGQSQLHRFQAQMSFQHSSDGGQTWLPYEAIANFVVQIVNIGTNHIDYYDGEILQMDVSGGTLPAGVMLRESPSKASLGRTSIRQGQPGPGGSYQISSFFDVFTELSVDGGQTWMPSDTGPANMVLWPNVTNGRLVCADGRPLPNCQVTIEFYNQNGLAAQNTTTTDANGYFTVCSHAIGPHYNSYFLISSPCCGHTWTVPSSVPYGDLGTLVCDQCGQQGGCVPPPGGMVDWWPFDESGGAVAYDIMGFGNHGGRQMGPVAIAGKVKNAICFPQGSYVHVLNHPEVNFFGRCPAGANPTESFTIDAWIKLDSVQGLHTILDKRENPQAPKGYVMSVYNGRFGFQMADGIGGPICGGGGACDNYFEPTASITPGVWYHVAVAVRRCESTGANVGRLYVNGTQKLAFTPRNGDISNTSDLVIGMRNPAFGYNHMQGCIDELEFFKRALDQTEIQAIYSADKAGKCKPCIQIECPSEVRAWTCNRSTNVCYALPAATGNCGDVTVVCTPPPCSAFSVGTTPVNCEARDTAGNKTNCTFNVVVVADTLPPVISCPTNRIERWICAGTAGVIVTYAVTATDDCDQNVTITCVPPSGYVFGPGLYNVVCTARDDCGQTDQCRFEVNVVEDKEPPSLACPGDMKVWTCEPNGMRVSYLIGVADDCDRAPTVTCTPPSGAFFPIGTTTVTCVARDVCGHQSTCSFNVTVVQDTLPPRIICPSDIRFDDCKEHVVQYTVTATDDCDPNPGILCSPASGSVFQPGTTTVTCFASDQCGHRVECSFQVVIDCPCVPPPADLVDWWPFDEPVGSTIANDIAGNVNNLGVHVNAPTIIPGKVQNAVCFNGDNQYIQVRDHPEINFLGDCANDVAESFTIDAWIRQDANAQQGVHTFVDKRDNPNSPKGYSFYVVNGRLGFQLGNGVGNPICNSIGSACFNYVEPNASITPGVWHFVAVTVERCRGMGTLYVDGVQVLTFTPLGGDYNNPADLYVGTRSPAFGGVGFAGCIDELEIFKRALSQAELQSIYNAGSSGKCKPCIVLHCPPDIRTWTCTDQAIVQYQPEVIRLCETNVNVTCTPPSGSPFPVGTTTVTCTATAGGAVVTSCSFTVTVVRDSGPPRITCPPDIKVCTCNDNGTNVTYTVTAVDDCDPSPSVTCTPPSGSNFPPGTTVVTCTAKDACGKESTCSFRVTVVVDRLVLLCPPDISTSTCSNRAVVNYQVRGSNTCSGRILGAPCVVADNGTGTASLPPATCEYDSADHMSIIDGLPAGSTLELDPVLSSFACISPAVCADCFVTDNCNPADGETLDFGHELKLTVHGTGAYAGYTRVLTIANGTGRIMNDARTPGDPVQSFNGTFARLQGQLPPGDPDFDLLRITAGDEFGLPSPGHTTLTRDGANWAVDSFFDITYRIDFVGRASGPFGGRSGSTTGTIRIGVGGPGTGTGGSGIVCNPPSGSSFPIGVTQVTCSATNCGRIERCTFTVTVRGDTQPPTIVCPPDITVQNDPGECGAKVSYLAPQASDNCPGVTVACSPTSGSFFPVGSTTVTCTATDGSGNSANCSFVVTVRDTEPPRIVCPTDIRRDGCRETVVDYTVSATDNCPGVTVTCAPPSGSPFPVGSTVVTCTATDGSGNTASCSFKVEIVCPCVPPPPGMVDWWTFDEASGPVANDIAGFNNVGVHMNGPTVIAGKVANALCFNGDNQYVEVRDHPEVNFLGSCDAGAAPAESFTIDAWIRADNIQAVATILDKRVNPSDPIGYSLFIANGRLGFQMADGSGGGGVCGPSASCQNYGEPTPSITVGNWHFIAVTVERCVNGGPGVGRLYVDGNIVLTFTPRKGDMNNPANLLIGVRQPAFGGANFRGCIDELEYFKRALTQAEIQSIYNAGSNGKCKPCLRCPDDIRVQTCARGTNVCYQVPEACPGLQVQCTPPPCSFFPANTSTLVVCQAYDSTGVVVERCQFAVTVITPRPKLEIVYLPNGLVRICWVSDCPGWRLQCTRSLVSPIMWQFVSAPVTQTGNRYCVTLPTKGAHQFYRLVRRDVKEVPGDGLFPPLGTYRSPDDVATAYFIGGDPDRPLLVRKFAHPIPQTPDRKPPPCSTCPPDIHQIHTQLSFQASMDGGDTWMDATAESDATVQVQGCFRDFCDDGYEAEILMLLARGNLGPRPFMIRESPSRASVGRTSIRQGQPGEPAQIGSFFDVFTELSLDGGQTWTPADTDVPMDLR